jgi:Sulfite exporter TauE/SafE
MFELALFESSHLIFLAVMLGAAGGLAGFLAGVFGVGGGTVVVPVLYEVFIILGVPDELRMPLCAGTSLALIIPTSIASYQSSQNKCGQFRFAEIMERSDHHRRARRHGAGALRARGSIQNRVRVGCAAHGGSADISRSLSDARTGRSSAPQTALRFDHRIVSVADWNWRRHPVKHDHDVPWARYP